jgi:hypothetical protein
MELGASHRVLANPIDFIPLSSAKDMVHDAQRGLLYITNGSKVERYDLASQTLLEPIVFSGTLTGIDLAPNENRLAVTGAGGFPLGKGGLHVVDLSTNAIERVEYDLAFYEGPSVSAAFLNASEVLLTTSFNGSGTVPLRRINVDDASFEYVATVQQNTRLSATPDRSRVAFTESNISNGPYGVYSTDTKAISRANLGFGYGAEVGISRDGDKIFMATGGIHVALVDDQLKLSPMAPTYRNTDSGTIGVVFSPINDLAFIAWTPGFYRDNPVLDVYNCKTMTPVGVIDAEPRFGDSFGLTYKSGRLKISRDGRTLFALAYNGVYVYDVSAFAIPEPTSLGLAVGLLAMVRGLRRRA